MCCEPFDMDAGRLQSSAQAISGGIVPAIAPCTTSNCLCPSLSACLENPGCNTGCLCRYGRFSRSAVYAKSRPISSASLTSAVPAHHLGAVQVQHGCQIQPALVGCNIGEMALGIPSVAATTDAARPALSACCNFKVVQGKSMAQPCRKDNRFAEAGCGSGVGLPDHVVHPLTYFSPQGITCQSCLKLASVSFSSAE